MTKLTGEPEPVASYRSLLSLAGTADSEYADVSIDKYGHVAEAFEALADEEDALAESIAEADRGEVISADEVLRRLSR